MYGILAEDRSDAATLKVIVRRLLADSSFPIRAKGFDGSGELLRKGANQLRLFRDLGCTRFIVCHDADGIDPAPKFDLVRSKIVRASQLENASCILVPVQKLEAWILADIESAAQIFSSWQPTAIDNPERIANPKEHLEKLSRDAKHKAAL